MKVLLTGASGFIGSNLVPELINFCETVIAVGRDFNNQVLDSKVIYHKQDLLDIHENDLPLTDGIDIIIHAAGQAHIAQNDENTPLFINNNTKTTERMLNLAQKLGVSKFIYLSTVAVMQDEAAISTDIYARTKKEAEELVIDFCSKNQISYIIVRPVAVYGEFDTKGNIFKLIRQIKQGIFPLANGGNTIKNIVYVKNLCAMLIECLRSRTLDNNIVIARDPETLTLNQISVIIKRELKTFSVLLPIPQVLFNALIALLTGLNSIGMISINAKSLRKMLVETNYTLSCENQDSINRLPFSSYEGIAKTVIWYLSWASKPDRK